MCQVKCPVKINTGDLIKSIRKEELGQASRASKTAMVGYLTSFLKSSFIVWQDKLH